MFVLKRMQDGKYVTPSGSEQSYTDRLQNAKLFLSREQASRDRCGNESIVDVRDEMSTR